MSDKLSFWTKAHIWFNHKLYPYSEIADTILRKFIKEGRVVDKDKFWTIVLHKGEHYGVWSVNYPYADCNQIYTMSQNNKFGWWTYKDALVCGVRPSRKVQIAWWEWLLKYGYGPNDFKHSDTCITPLGIDFYAKK